MKAQVSSHKAMEAATPETPAPDTGADGANGQAKVNGASANGKASDVGKASAANGSNGKSDASSVKSVATSEASKKSKDAAPPTQDKKSADLSGKLNNLVTTDLKNIVNGRDFMIVRECFSLIFPQRGGGSSMVF